MENLKVPNAYRTNKLLNIICNNIGSKMAGAMVFNPLRLIAVPKQFIFLPLFLFVFTTLHAQDVMTLKTGEKIDAKILEVGIDMIKFKRFHNMDGPIYDVGKSNVFMIEYENGTKDIFGWEETPKATTTSMVSSERTNTTPREEKPSSGLANGSLNINPLGLLQFGPIIQWEQKIAPKAVVAPFIRYAFLGLLTQLSWNGFDKEDRVNPLSFGAGIGAKGFSKEYGNTFYYGGYGEYSRIKAHLGEGQSYETEEVVQSAAAIFNFGYRWRSENGTHINLGLFLGSNYTFSDEQRWADDGELFISYEDDVYPIGLLELSFGF